MNVLGQTGTTASINHKTFLASYATALMSQGTKFALTSTITSIGKLSLHQNNILRCVKSYEHRVLVHCELEWIT
jgi:hypothetical protein